MKIKVKCPELTLPPKERRNRYRQMAAITAGCNPITKRQLRRLPSRPTKAGRQKEKWLMRRYMKKQGLTLEDLRG